MPEIKSAGPLSLRTVMPILLVASAVSAGFQSREFKNEEYGFKATIPQSFPVCYGQSGTHVHGVWTVLGGKDCENRQLLPVLGIWADFNVLFHDDALEILRGGSRCAGALPAWASGEWNNAISGLRTAMCRSDQNGEIDIVLQAQAGKWGAGFDDAKDKPHINYTVYLSTTKNRYDQDLKTFRAFLKSISITTPK